MFKIQVVGSDLFWTLVIFTTLKSRRHGYLRNCRAWADWSAFFGASVCRETWMLRGWTQVGGARSSWLYNTQQIWHEWKACPSMENNSFLKIIETKASLCPDPMGCDFWLYRWSWHAHHGRKCWTSTLTRQKGIPLPRWSLAEPLILFTEKDLHGSSTVISVISRTKVEPPKFTDIQSAWLCGYAIQFF